MLYFVLIIDQYCNILIDFYNLLIEKKNIIKKCPEILIIIYIYKYIKYTYYYVIILFLRCNLYSMKMM